MPVLWSRVLEPVVCVQEVQKLCAAEQHPGFLVVPLRDGRPIPRPEHPASKHQALTTALYCHINTIYTAASEAQREGLLQGPPEEAVSVPAAHLLVRSTAFNHSATEVRKSDRPRLISPCGCRHWNPKPSRLSARVASP
ncbi:hypothetical protein SKAU_G00323290 [Synaphobranchus kaupii]|uniref:Uncharacterized protein n=1 Tax=Synaphobranchus kaupii TaxID=118154 RepID=A0A9Q1EP29_SYNKA|nr:hypothetical protein SKAU_G00323290 [Synaphobranchus kaupii]